MAAVPQPAGVGCLRGFDLLYRLADLLVFGPDSGFCHAPRQSHAAKSPVCVRFSFDGLARLSPPLAELRNGLPVAGRVRDATGAVGTYRGELRFRGRDRARLA